MSNYTNELKKDLQLIDKSRVKKATGIIKFTKNTADWFTVWDGRIVKRYSGQKLPKTNDFAMRPYIETYYNKERRQAVFDMYDARMLKFDNLITCTYFTDYLSQLRKT